MNYVECDVPADMTLIEWRRAKRLPAFPRRGLRWLALLCLRA